MTSHDVERAYVVAMLDHEEARLNEASAEMRAELDALRESWSTGFEQQAGESEARMRKIRDDQAAWFNGLYDDGPDEGTPTDVGQVQGAGASAGPLAPASPVPPGPGQPTRQVAELAADDIKNMSMREYAERRAELGVRSGTVMSHLYGH